MGSVFDECKVCKAIRELVDDVKSDRGSNRLSDSESAMLREHATKWDTLTFHGMRVSELDLTITEIKGLAAMAYEQSRRNW